MHLKDPRPPLEEWRWPGAIALEESLVSERTISNQADFYRIMLNIGIYREGTSAWVDRPGIGDLRLGVQYCSLESISVPGSVDNLGKSRFAGCYGTVNRDVSMTLERESR
jgi:hypothetical protein